MIQLIGKNHHKILIISKKWIPLSEYNPDSEKQLIIDFDKKASEICSSFSRLLTFFILSIVYTTITMYIISS